MPRKPAPAKKKKTSSRTKSSSKAASGQAAASTSKTARKTTKAGSGSTRKTNTKATAAPARKKTSSKRASSKAKTGSIANTKPTSKSKSASKKSSKAAAAKPAPAEKRSAALAKVGTSKPKASEASGNKGVAAAAGNRKGITIVSDKGTRGTKARSAPKPATPHRSQLLGPDAPKRKPLIPSGPNAQPPSTALSDDAAKPAKSPFGKRELARFRAMLLEKRAALIGDITQLEAEALSLGKDESSHTPQHMAEQGTDSAGQTLALDLAAADRRLLREIDDAIRRIDEGVYGLCEMTGRPIRVERLRELPWARFSIDAARELERRSKPGSW
ncbi:MAG: hypothetical protein Kow0022_15570 [Phycisphaerales bacterium]